MPGADAARKPQRIALSATAPMLTRRRAQTWMDSKTIRRRKSLLDLPKRQRSIGSRAEASGDRPGSQLADARSIRRPILVSASADPFAPQGAIYRRGVDERGPLVPVTGGLPAWPRRHRPYRLYRCEWPGSRGRRRIVIPQ